MCLNDGRVTEQRFADQQEPATDAAVAGGPPLRPGQVRSSSLTLRVLVLAALVLPVVIYMVVQRDERPATKAVISWINSKPAGLSFGKSEVTLAQFRACVQAGVCEMDTYETMTDLKTCNWGHPGRDDYPMNCVNWHGATAFCRWAGGRLPTEDEWYAEASNGDTRAFPWGSEPATCARTVMLEGSIGCRKGRSWPVCSKPAGNSVSGLCDMSGNVWEWTSSVDGAARVLRGGGWDICTQDYLGCSGRVKFSPSFKFVNLGFRCVRSSR